MNHAVYNISPIRWYIRYCTRDNGRDILSDLNNYMPDPWSGDIDLAICIRHGNDDSASSGVSSSYQSINQSKHISIAPYVASESEAP